MGSPRKSLPSEKAESVKSEPEIESDVTFAPDDDPKDETEEKPEEHTDFVMDHVPKKFGLEDVRKYNFKGMTPSQRIAAIASSVADRSKGELYTELENDDHLRVQPPKRDGDEIVVGATVDVEGVPYTQYPLRSQEEFYKATVLVPNMATMSGLTFDHKLLSAVGSPTT